MLLLEAVLLPYLTCTEYFRLGSKDHLALTYLTRVTLRVLLIIIDKQGQRDSTLSRFRLVNWSCLTPLAFHSSLYL